jgi:PAS domain S-box-containing protein
MCFQGATMTKYSDGIWIIDAEANTLFANIAMSEILGTTVAEMLGKPSFTYVFPEDIEAAQQLFDSKRRGDGSPFRFRLRRADGSAIWVNVLGTPMMNAAGEMLGIVGTFSVAE